MERERQGWLESGFDLYSCKKFLFTSCLSAFCYCFICYGLLIGKISNAFAEEGNEKTSVWNLDLKQA